MVLGNWPFGGGGLGHEGGPLMNGISALGKETPLSSLAPNTTRRYKEKFATWKRALCDHACTPISDFQPPGLWDYISIVYKLGIFVIETQRLRHSLFAEIIFGG